MTLKQTIETVPFAQVKARIGDLNRMGMRVLSISVDRERDQMWLLAEKAEKS